VINVDSYIKLVKSIKPSVFQSLCDSDTPRESCSNKRLSTSVKRTVEYLDYIDLKREYDDELASLPLLASLEGGMDSKSRSISLKDTLVDADKKKLVGFVLEGFHNQGHPSDFVMDMETNSIIKSTMDQVSQDSVRVMFGSFSPEIMLSLFSLGIDVVDSSFATGLTEEGKALVISKQDSIPGSKILDLNQDLFREDMDPLSVSCRCHSCLKGFSRSYIHHLINTKEMLARVLLNLHNLYSLQEFVSLLQRKD